MFCQMCNACVYTATQCKLVEQEQAEHSAAGATYGEGCLQNGQGERSCHHLH